jgi:transposase
MQVFTNTVLAETFQQPGATRTDAHALLARRERYDPGEVLPAGVVLVTVGADVQAESPHPEVLAELEAEIHGSASMRYAHRLHAVWLRERGMADPEIAKRFGITERTLDRWARDYRLRGLAGLREKPRPGRPRRLTAAQRAEVSAAINATGSRWSGPMLSRRIVKQFGIRLSESQCRRILREARR